MVRRLLILAVLLAGCTSPEVASPPTSSSPSSSTSVPDLWTKLAGRAEKAYVAKDAFGPDAPWKSDYPATPGGIEDKTPELGVRRGQRQLRVQGDARQAVERRVQDGVAGRARVVRGEGGRGDRADPREVEDLQHLSAQGGQARAGDHA